MSVHHRAQAVRKLRMCWLAELRLCVETGTCLFKYRPISARNSFVHLTVGAFKCIVVNDGTLSYTTPARVHFPNAPSDQLAVALRKYDLELDLWEEWISPLPCLIIQTGMHRILVDTGLGKADFAPNAGKLHQNLQVEGIQPGYIDIVILSHAHGDHIGGNVDPMGKAAFPNARYVMRKEEWDIWTSEEILSQPRYEWMIPFVHGQLLLLFDRFELSRRIRKLCPAFKPCLHPGIHQATWRFPSSRTVRKCFALAM